MDNIYFYFQYILGSQYSRRYFDTRLPNIVVIVPSSGDVNDMTLLFVRKDSIFVKFDGLQKKNREKLFLTKKVK